MESIYSKNRTILTAIVYVSLLLDNILLTIIVPILPDYLASLENKNVTTYNMPSSVLYKNFDLHYIPASMLNVKHPVAGNSIKNLTKDISLSHIPETQSTIETENESIGTLLAVKAFVQLICNPIVGSLTNTFGCKNLIFLGTINLLVASMIFAMGESFAMLFIGRAIQGVGSACIAVCGMSMVAYLYPEEERRSKVMGIVLGSVALGVLIGYPLGGFLYDFVSESAPFIIIAALLFFNLAFQLSYFDLSSKNDCDNNAEEAQPQQTTSKWIELLTNKMFLIISIAIWISTSAMAILEPCLPIWLITHLHPKKWQLGTVFIPDSLGYLIGTNFFGSIAYKAGQIKMSVFALMMVGISCVVIPEAKSVSSLIIPHLGLGLGIGILDASLVPLMAKIADSNFNKLQDFSEHNSDEVTSNYGSVYAIQQTAVSLAYSIVPFLGGELAHSIGFPMIMRILGLVNFMYGPFLLFVTLKQNLNHVAYKQPDLLLKEVDPANYKRFYDSID
ncbi:unnamed protein product [Diamesa serratosioi]